MFLIEIPQASLRVFCVLKVIDLQTQNVSRTKEGNSVSLVLDTIFTPLHSVKTTRSDDRLILNTKN